MNRHYVMLVSLVVFFIIGTILIYISKSAAEKASKGTKQMSLVRRLVDT